MGPITFISAAAVSTGQIKIFVYFYDSQSSRVICLSHELVIGAVTKVGAALSLHEDAETVL